MAQFHELPPAIQLLLDEDLEGVHTPSGLQRHLRKIAPELIRQSRWAHSEYSYVDTTTGPTTQEAQFRLRTSGALDPFSTVEICGTLGCRILAAEQFARTAGVLADTVVVPDVITPALAKAEEFDDGTAKRVLGDMVILDRLKPLVSAGIVTFSDARLGYCAEHHREAFERVATVVDSLLAEIGRELQIDRTKNMVRIRATNLFSQPMVWFHTITAEERDKKTREIGLVAFRDILRNDISALLRDMRSAERIQATLASGSRIGLLAISQIEQRGPTVGDIGHWEAMRSVDLPWIRNLSPNDVLRLREEAGSALPRLRCLLESKLATVGPDTDERVQAIVGELRAEASEVQAELAALKIARERGFRAISGGLGLTIAIYGLAAGFVMPAVGLGSLLSLLGLIHAAERNDERQLDQLTSRPGYVLLKAQELATHRQ